MSPSTRKQLIRAAAIVALLLLTWYLNRDTDSPSADPTRPDSTVTSTAGSQPTGDVDGESGLEWIAESELPSEALDTLKDIDNGGPYDYPGKDDTTFTNREGLLPDQQEGYYREYTVETPGSDDRGARRIVTGQGGEFYYTDDHYSSFRRIAR